MERIFFSHIFLQIIILNQKLIYLELFKLSIFSNDYNLVNFLLVDVATKIGFKIKNKKILYIYLYLQHEIK